MVASVVAVERSPLQRRFGLAPDLRDDALVERLEHRRLVLREDDVHVTNSQHPDVVEDCLMHATPSVEDALEPGMRVLVVPDALNTLLATDGSVTEP